MKKLSKIIDFICDHPLTKDHKIKALLRFAKWQFVSRLYPHSFILPFLENSKLIVKRGMSGATGNLYVGLHDFMEMAFLLHFLRQEDLFGDIGANIGTYTILASGVAKARSVSVEPVPATFKYLKDNIQINNLETLVSPFNNGAGAAAGFLGFTKNLDTINHVADSQHENGAEMIQVEILTLDQIFQISSPNLLKIDVEGFEFNVLKGARHTLESEDLKAIVIELNSSGNRYGTKDEDVHTHLQDFGFLPFKYNPFIRILEPLPTFLQHGNTIYIKDKSFVEKRIESSRYFSVIGKSF